MRQMKGFSMEKLTSKELESEMLEVIHFLVSDLYSSGKIKDYSIVEFMARKSVESAREISNFKLDELKKEDDKKIYKAATGKDVDDYKWISINNDYKVEIPFENCFSDYEIIYKSNYTVEMVDDNYLKIPLSKLNLRIYWFHLKNMKNGKIIMRSKQYSNRTQCRNTAKRFASDAGFEFKEMVK